MWTLSVIVRQLQRIDLQSSAIVVRFGQAFLCIGGDFTTLFTVIICVVVNNDFFQECQRSLLHQIAVHFR